MKLTDLVVYSDITQSWIHGPEAKPTALYNLRNNLEMLKKAPDNTMLKYGMDRNQLIKDLEELYEELANEQP